MEILDKINNIYIEASRGAAAQSMTKTDWL